MLVKLEKDRLIIKAETLAKQLQQVKFILSQIEEKFTGVQNPNADNQDKDNKKDLSKKPGVKLSPIPTEDRINPHN